MRLDEYLKALEECPDEQLEGGTWRLTADFGVYDNYPICLRTDFDKVVRDLTNSNYELENINNDEVGKRHYLLDYVPGTVKLQIREDFRIGGLIRSPKTDKQREQIYRIDNEFNLLIILHTYQKKKMEGVHWLRPIALVIEDLSRYAQREEIPLCLPKTSGISLTTDESFNRIVYSCPR